MELFVASLVAVVEANQRHVIWRVLRQLALVIATGVGLTQLSGAWWWLCLVGFLIFLLGATFLTIGLVGQFRLKLEPPWRALGLHPLQHGSQLLELHLVEGGVTLLPVPPRLVPGVVSAAREAGLEVVTEPGALEALKAKSALLERLHDMEALLPHVPTPELRGELSSMIARVRTLEPTGCDEVLRQLEIHLMAEKSAQTTTSLRGPKPVYEKELREQIAVLTRLMDEALIIDKEN